MEKVCITATVPRDFQLTYGSPYIHQYEAWLHHNPDPKYTTVYDFCC